MLRNWVPWGSLLRRFDISLLYIYERELLNMVGRSVWIIIFCCDIYLSNPWAAPSKKTVFVLGEAGVEAELASENIKFIGGTDPSFRRDIQPSDYTVIASGQALDESVGVVLAGLDFHVNYLKLSYAFAYLQRGAQFLATNVDSTLPNAGSFFPGAGSVSAPLTKATGQEPLALGKPSQAMMDSIEGKFKFDRKRTCMIGDRLNTDIKFGLEGGLGGTLAVLTGVSTKQEWEAENAEIVPRFYADKLSDLLISRTKSAQWTGYPQRDVST